MHGKVYNDRRTEAKRLGVSIRTLDRRVKEDGFPFIRFGFLMMFDPEVSDAYMVAHTYRGRAAERASATARPSSSDAAQPVRHLVAAA